MRPRTTKVTGDELFSAALKGLKFLLDVVTGWLDRRKSRHAFHLTPITQACMWGMARQPDGTIVTSVNADFHAKNRTDGNLCLVRARLLKPIVKGLPIQDVVFVTGTNAAFIPPHTTVIVRVTIAVAGTPKQRTGPPPPSLK